MAGKLDLVIEKGSTFERVFTWYTVDTATGTRTVVDLTGYSARSMFREQIEDPEPFLSLTTENNGIELVGSEGKVIIRIPADVSTAIAPESGVWDLEVYQGTEYVIRLVEGRVKLKPEVTR
jgi:hypothetical protein